MEIFIRKEPMAKKYFKEWYGSREFINRFPRYCLWLGECSPSKLRKRPECMKRVEAVRNYRMESPNLGTVKLLEELNAAKKEVEKVVGEKPISQKMFKAI